ncbi:Acetylcholine receptor subunit epsilon [Durusdinium trenchii]|uniref:Acetylcholine receptor subunit epsilon n=1 Tax=Durusdinium trenchii TaxID=1381693 RepID=A0ABP0JKE2_9DINO
MEWFDPAAVGMPPGDISEDNRKKLWIPEIALQNTLKTGVEIHYPPEIIFSEKGHVAAKVLYQAMRGGYAAMMQMEIDMRLFPFDTQRLNIVLGLRARRDRDRAVFCRFCHVDSQIRLDEWKLLGAFHHTDRPDGRARVQFGVVIGRGYMYYVLNVLMTLWAIASSSFAGYLLQMRPPFDRLRFCISILFAQTTFRGSVKCRTGMTGLSIDSKLPIVSYATAFDHFAMACQLLLLSIILGDVIVVMLADRMPFDRSRTLKPEGEFRPTSSGNGLLGANQRPTDGLASAVKKWPRRIIAILSFSLWVSRQRKKNASATWSCPGKVDHRPTVLHLNQSGESHEKERAGTAVVRRQCRGLVWGDPEEKNLEDFSPEAIDQVGRLRGRLRYTSARRLSPTEEKLSSDAVAVSTYLWFIHDIDPIQAQYECKFTSYIEWICPNAVGMPEDRRLSKEELLSLWQVELKIDEGPDAYVTDSNHELIYQLVPSILLSPQVCSVTNKWPRQLLSIQNGDRSLPMRWGRRSRNFPFDEQSLPIDFVMPSEKDQQRAFVFRQCDLAPLAYHLDEWTVQGTHHKVGFHEGMSQAAMYVKVKRNSKYYVVSVLGVMLGISSLVFTVRVAETDRFRACHFWVSELK